MQTQRLRRRRDEPAPGAPDSHRASLIFVTGTHLIPLLLTATLLHATLFQEAAAQEAEATEAAAATEAEAASATEVVQEASAEPAAPSVDDARARGLFEQGAAAYEAGHYDAALGFFEESYALSGRATLLFNMGASADRLRQNEKALENYEAYIAAVPEARNAPEVSSRVRVLREDIAQQQRLEASLANLEAETDEGRAVRRRRRLIGGITGAVLLIGGAVLIGVLASGDRFESYDSNVIQTLRSPL
ncbi:MAG: tetratricopeptide (TPR) repeat protein [Polyangiales bacterium]|jgi:tetratricopeptide (TPR) repeat protein